MRHQMKRRAVAGAAAAAASVLLAACGGGGGLGEEEPAEGSDAASGGDPCAALEGEDITFVVPYDPGGGFDVFVRTLEPFLEEELGDVEVNVENQPGGGGLVGANAVFQSDPGDLTIGLINYPGAVFAELTEQEGATFDNTQWTILGRLGALPPLVYTGPDSQYTDFESLLGASEPVRFGIGGVGSDAYYAAVALAQAFDFPNEIIGGYPGSGEADAALLVGEVDASINSSSSALEVVEGSGANPIVVLSSEPLEELPDVPVIGDFAEGEQAEPLQALAAAYDVERVVVGPPEMDEGTTQCLGDAIYAAATSDGYAEEMEAQERPIAPLSREETAELTQQVADSADALRELVQEQ